MKSGYRYRIATIILAVCILTIILPLFTFAQHPGDSVVIIDLQNKQNITGNTEIAFAWGQQFEPPQDLLRGIMNLREAMIRWTKVETSLDRHLLVSDSRILNMPFVFITTDKRFELTQTEINNLRNYIDNGGFIFADNADPSYEASASGASLKQMLKDVIPNARFEPLPNSHDIYHSFFDLDGPPQGAEINVYTTSGGTVMTPPRHYLEGVRYKGRIVAVYSDKGYVKKWAEDSDNEPQLRMGVNLIIHALTQEGSIASKNIR